MHGRAAGRGRRLTERGTERTGGAPELSTPLARRFVRHLVGFGVAVAVGCAPFLGTLRVPGFTALLDLFPLQLQGRFVAMSPFVMGVVALAVQFYAAERLSRKLLKRWFGRGLLLLGATFVLLLVVYALAIVEVPYLQGERTARFVVGFDRTDTCPCPPQWSNPQCMADKLDVVRVEQCWSPATVRSFELLLTLSYLTLIGGFAAMTGLLVLAEQRRRGGASPTPSSG